MEADEFIKLATQGDENAALAEVKRDVELAAARNEAGVSVICLAVYHRRGSLAAALASHRADLDIFEATCIGDLRRVRELLSGEPGSANSVSPDGFSPVGYGAFFGHVEVLGELVRRGGDVGAASRNAMKVCPIHSAVAHSNHATAVELARIVLDAGADVNARQQAGYTALHEAAMNGNVELVEFLLKHGADPALANDEGTKAVDLARSKGHERVVDVLRLREKGT